MTVAQTVDLIILAVAVACATVAAVTAAAPLIQQRDGYGCPCGAPRWRRCWHLETPEHR